MSHPTTDGDSDATDATNATGDPGVTDDAESAVDDAIEAFRAGEPVLIHDDADREGETDIVYPATAVDTDAVARLRNDAGGLICVALSDAVGDAFDLPFLQEALDHPATSEHDLAYDERSSFSLTVNHRETFTGITDADRALTIAELGAAAAAADAGEYGVDDFAAEFRSPGHVHLLRAAPDLLSDRAGHTELGIALADAADCAPAVVVCEMLDDETGGARSPTDAAAYADRHGLVYIEGAKLEARLG
ncbi:3,4-dihydroxy-2-butanone-4-phosphate synthase [Halonotius terrestris]|uniref:3,4-dihydroxy-2-butanone 4-phosphate synthase n=1 Tax=Halonotius terrestris TaxID=2487750 RepID=A0A8J8TC73_9EURY|nr:3,4-dihydroxy-2-butanone-4-phosphate synthase [Halonotius terrestris]TQQ82892.1 3,4-dihydroxy-2-butanone-4-phosphate synthase [Halonotius terrestris]